MKWLAIGAAVVAAGVAGWFFLLRKPDDSTNSLDAVTALPPPGSSNSSVVAQPNTQLGSERGAPLPMGASSGNNPAVSRSATKPSQSTKYPQWDIKNRAAKFEPLKARQ